LQKLITSPILQEKNENKRNYTVPKFSPSMTFSSTSSFFSSFSSSNKNNDKKKSRFIQYSDDLDNFKIKIKKLEKTLKQFKENEKKEAILKRITNVTRSKICVIMPSHNSF
jgi:hypothetical protein